MTKKAQKAEIVDQLLECINSGREVGGFWHHEVIRAARRSKGLTLLQLANKVGCTQGFLSRFENGDKYPTPYLLEKILQVLELGAFDSIAEEVAPLKASKRKIGIIEKQNRLRADRLADSQIIQKIARVRMLSAVILTALREKGYCVKAKLPDPGNPDSLEIVADGGGDRRFTISIKEET